MGVGACDDPHTSPAGGEHSPVSDIEVLFKEAKVRQRRRRLGWLIVVICMRGCRHACDHEAYREPSFYAEEPAKLRSSLTSRRDAQLKIVSWTSNHHVVVISRRSGAILRTLASDERCSVRARFARSLGVSPRRSLLQLRTNRRSEPARCSGGSDFQRSHHRRSSTRSWRWFFPIGQRKRKVLGLRGWNGVGEAPYMLPSGGITIATLAGDNVSSVQTLHPDARQTGQGASDLSWSPDSDRLSFSLLNGGNDTTTSWTIALASADGSLASAQQIPLRPGLSWSGYWKTAKNGEHVGIGVRTSPPVDYPSTLAGSQAIVTIDLSTGKAIERLFRINGAAVCTTSVPSDCQADFVNPLTVDGVGTSVLVGGAIPLAYGSVSTSGKSYLYRRSTGDSQPVRLTPGVLVATWSPG